jgi:hypothetical protein
MVVVGSGNKVKIAVRASRFNLLTRCRCKRAPAWSRERAKRVAALSEFIDTWRLGFVTSSTSTAPFRSQVTQDPNSLNKD